MASRFPIKNGVLQSDLDAGGRNINNFPQLEGKLDRNQLKLITAHRVADQEPGAEEYDIRGVWHYDGEHNGQPAYRLLLDDASWHLWYDAGDGVYVITHTSRDAANITHVSTVPGSQGLYARYQAETMSYEVEMKNTTYFLGARGESARVAVIELEGDETAPTDIRGTYYRTDDFEGNAAFLRNIDGITWALWFSAGLDRWVITAGLGTTPAGDYWLGQPSGDGAAREYQPQGAAAGVVAGTADFAAGISEIAGFAFAAEAAASSIIALLREDEESVTMVFGDSFALTQTSDPYAHVILTLE